MAHPMRNSAKDGAQAKLARITSGGQMPQTNKSAPPEGGMAGEPRKMNAGYGLDDEAPRARGDRLSRARGGRTCGKADGGDVSAIEQANRNQAQSAPAARARGGRTKKGTTQVNVIVATGGPPGGAPTGAGPVIPPAGSAVPPAAPPAPPAMKPPMGGPPGAMPPGAMPPGMMRAKGGKVSHPDEKEDRALFGKMLKERGLKDGGPAERAAGGRMTAGAESGVGRLEKAANQRKIHPQPV